MKYTKDGVIKHLKSMVNKFNERFLDNIEETVERWFDDDNIEDRINMGIPFKEALYGRELVKEYKTLYVTRNPFTCEDWDDCYQVYQKGYKYPRKLKEHLTEIEAFNLATEYDKIYTAGCEPVIVNFPTGVVVFTNLFKKDNDYAFDLPDELRYKEDYGINFKFGRVNTMVKLLELHNLGYVQTGNTSVSIWQVSSTEIVITGSSLYYEEDGWERECEIPSHWQFLGNISCDVWRIEFIDNLFLSDEIEFVNGKVEANLESGKYLVENYFMDIDPYQNTKQPTVWVKIKLVP